MQLGWIDFSKEDRQKALDVINLLSEQGAVDELGIGIVRDAFANYFFPGTSTIQTRAKYFLIVPYILRDAVDGRYGKDVNRILRAIDTEEKECGIKFHTLNLLCNKLVIDEFVFFVVPAVKLSNFFTNLFCWMFSCKLSHSLEVNLTTSRGHIK